MYRERLSLIPFSLTLRNNLYWSHGLRLPVLWYGDASKLPEDIVEVQPIFCRNDAMDDNDDYDEGVVVDEGGGDGLISPTVLPGPIRLNSSCTAVVDVHEVKSKEYAVTGICPPATHSERPSCTPMPSSSSSSLPTTCTSSSSSSPSSSSSSAAPPSSEKRCVRRGSLTPLDDDMLQLHCTHKLTSHLSGAFLDFSEWDDHLRDSYTWSERVTNLLRCVCHMLNVNFTLLNTICCHNGNL